MSDRPEYPENIKSAIEDSDVLLTFLFSIGDSTGGAVGTCLRVIAQTPESAVETAKDALESESADSNFGYEPVSHNDVEYVANYYNPDAVSEGDIVPMETEIYDVLQQEEALRGAYS